MHSPAPLSLCATARALCILCLAATGLAAQRATNPEVAAIDARRAAGDTAGVREAYEGVLRRLDARGVPGDRSTVEALQGLANLLYQRRDYAAALRAQERLAPLVDSLAGAQHAASALEWHNLGFLRAANGRHTEAIPVFERALEVRRAVLPAGDPLTRSTIQQLATALRQRATAAMGQRDYVATWNAYERALALTDESDGPESQPSMASLIGLVQLYPILGSEAAGSAMLAIGPPRIIAIGDRAVALLEREVGADDPRVRTVRANLETFRLGAARMTLDPRATRDAARTALTAAERAYGPTGSETVTTLVRLARAETEMRDYPAARAALERALRVLQAAGAPSLALADAERAQAELLEAERRLPEARAQYERALATAERSVPATDPQLAPYLQALASLLNGLGDRQQAAALTARAQRLTGGATAVAGTPDAAIAALARAGELDAAGGATATAEARRLREEALRVLVPAFGERHIMVATAQMGLARNYAALGDYDAAERTVNTAIESVAQTFGRRSSEHAFAIALRADVQRERGDLAAAERTMRTAVALYDSTLGPGHPQAFPRKFDLADLLLAQRKTAEGTAVVLETSAQVDRYAREVLPMLAIAEQQAFLESTLPLATTFVLMAAHAQPSSMPVLYDRLGGWKGLLLRGVERQAAVARLAEDARAGADVRRLAAVRRDLSALAQRASSLDATALRTERDRLTTEKERLERQLAALVPEREDPWRGATALSSRLPKRTAFVDIYRHGAGRQARYAAVVTLSGGMPREVDLGPAAPIDAATTAWRRAATGDQFGIDEFWAVMSRTMDPIAAALPDSLRFLWISPDAQLSRLPWATLNTYNRKTGVANAAQVPSARALVEMLGRAAPTGRGDVLLVGGVDFSAGRPAPQRPSLQWTDLPGTGAEVAAIQRRADSSRVTTRVLRGAAATPTAVREALAGARIAHLATHGFFFGESEAVAASRGVVAASPVAVAPAVASRNPLAESGLALAGANVTPSGNLTAEDLLGLDLRGLELIVLSACETGRGAEVTGQGVLGLQASILAAGTRGMLMSLWKVPDASTAYLMERFYAYYLDGASAPTALRDAQRDVLRREEFKNPIHWAGWVYVGPIDG